MRVILGVDPGYRNLGLAILDISGPRPSILWSKNKSIGSPSAGMEFVRFLWPLLDELHTEYGIEAIATETPPFIAGRPKVSALLWAISSIIASWGHAKGIPLRHAQPLTLKRACSRILGREYDRKNIPKKKDIREAVKKLLGARGRTSHEDDAILSIITLYTDLVPDGTTTAA